VGGRFSATTAAVKSSRAEFRRASQRAGVQNMGGCMRVIFGNFISVIQVLNIKSEGNPTGKSEPVAQLAVRLNDDNMYEFYIVQQGQVCTGIKPISAGDWVHVNILYQLHETPIFQVIWTLLLRKTWRL